MSVTNNIIQTVVMGGAGIGTARALAGSTRPALGAAATKIDKSSVIVPVVATAAGAAAGVVLSGHATERGYSPEDRNVALGTTAVAGIGIGTWATLVGGKQAGIAGAVSGVGMVGAAFLVANGIGLKRPGSEEAA